jgi:hypothetical protein
MGYTWADLYDGLEMIPFFFVALHARTHWVAFFHLQVKAKKCFFEAFSGEMAGVD